ncbi:glutaredoxin-C6-like isoform X1 [Phragmites australis]|uniref:glutaredoxin-C6-like isoform X1 n=1 Tax=Phragmites australis TaxID=29695 RepID=UPI002D7821B2|nr:glutaredoxin-C6-like isoform X1 [Phragmites australis]
MGITHSSSSVKITQPSLPRAPAPSRPKPSKTPMALEKAKEIVASSPVVVFRDLYWSLIFIGHSKTYCPFCTRVKQLLAQLGASYKAVELDVESDGSELQTALAEWTGQRTVPNVFIKGERVGGCDDTMAMHNGGKLVPLLTVAGAIASANPSM